MAGYRSRSYSLTHKGWGPLEGARVIRYLPGGVYEAGLTIRGEYHPVLQWWNDEWWHGCPVVVVGKAD